MVGVKAGHVARSVTARGGTLDLPLLLPAALWMEEERTRRGEGEVGMDKEDKSKWLMPSDSLLG